MNWDALGAMGELAGAAAVVLTLLYLSRQIRENSKQLKLASLTDTIASFNDGFAPIYNNDRNMRIWVTGQSDPDALDAEDLEIFFLFTTRIMAVFDTIVEHHRLGIQDEERFANYTGFAVQFVESPGGKAWLARGQYELSTLAKDELGLSRS